MIHRKPLIASHMELETVLRMISMIGDRDHLKQAKYQAFVVVFDPDMWTISKESKPGICIGYEKIKMRIGLNYDLNDKCFWDWFENWNWPSCRSQVLPRDTLNAMSELEDFGMVRFIKCFADCRNGWVEEHKPFKAICNTAIVGKIHPLNMWKLTCEKAGKLWRMGAALIVMLTNADLN